MDQLLYTINHQVFWCDNLRRRSFTDSLLVGGGRRRRGATPATVDGAHTVCVFTHDLLSLYLCGFAVWGSHLCFTSLVTQS